MMTLFNCVLKFREGFPKKAAVLLDFVQMRGGGGPAHIYWHLFISAFLVVQDNSIGDLVTQSVINSSFDVQ